MDARAIAAVPFLLAACSSPTDMPATVVGVLYDTDVECEGSRCDAPAETFDAAAVIGEDASRFAPDGVYVYGWFWRDDGRFVEIELDVPDPVLAEASLFVEYREWAGETRVFASEDASGEVHLTARDPDEGTAAGTFSLLLESGDEVREIHGGSFTTHPGPEALAGGRPAPPRPTEPGPAPQPDPDHYDDDWEEDHVDVFVEGGCSCVAEDPPPDEWESDGCDDGSGGGGCEGDTAPSGDSGAGCDGDSSGGDIGGGGCECEGDAMAAAASPGRRSSLVRRIWTQTYPFATVAGALVWWRRRLRRAMRSRR